MRLLGCLAALGLIGFGLLLVPMVGWGIADSSLESMLGAIVMVIAVFVLGIALGIASLWRPPPTRSGRLCIHCGKEVATDRERYCNHCGLPFGVEEPDGGVSRH